MFRTITDQNQQEIIEFVTFTAYVAEIKEWDNRAHLERMRRYCYLLADGLGLPSNEARLFSIAAILHDVGKIAIPDAILKNTANLEPHEWAITERHTIEGARILRGSPSVVYQTAEIIALTHHERWNGSGYPEGLKGNQIPLSGRICALADVFDALTTRRSYKNEVTPQEAVVMIREASDKLFDPQLVIAFVSRFDEVQSVLRSIPS